MTASAAVGERTVEAVIREQLSTALGGRRGMLEGAAPTLAFTLVYLPTRELRSALLVGVSIAAALLVARLVQRQSPQFVLGSTFGIALAALIALRSGRAEDVFLPGIIWNAVTGSLLLLSAAVRWPAVGLLLGSATGGSTAWRDDPGVVKVCTRLTLIFALPCAIRVAVQLPLYLAGKVGWLAATKLALGWPLYVGALAVMVWLLTRGRTPEQRLA